MGDEDGSTLDAGTIDQSSTPDSTVADGQAAQATEQTFLDDEALMDKIRTTPELDHVFKKMQGAYTRRTQGLAKFREAASIVERFNTDPEFARQTIQQRAGQLGLHIGNPTQQTVGTPNGSSTLPPELIEAVKTNLSPELQWMAPALAASQWAGMQMALKPIQDNQVSLQQQTFDSERDALEAQLSEKHPGWEQHEDDMKSLQAFLQSPKLSDRRWGSKLELLHKLTVGDGQATAEAARRMGQAAKSRSVAGSPVATPTPNIAEQVRKPKQNQDAWDTAAKFAMSELARQGIKVS